MKILFIKPLNSTFVRADEIFLTSRYPVRSFLYRPGNGIRHWMSQIELIVWLFFHLRGTTVLYIWFADYHSWLPVFIGNRFHKKSIVVLGGYDVACLPQFDYGVFVRKFRGWCAKYTIKNADFVLPVAKALEEEVHLRVHEIKGKVRVVPTGYDADRWKVSGGEKRSKILTVAIAETVSRLQIKGLDLFAQVARSMGDLTFTIIGLKGTAKNIIEEMKIENLTLLGEVSPDQMQKYYGESKVYAQLSIREGLPNSVCEAMLCECIPVGTRVGGIPEAMGDCGFLVESRQVDEVVRVIRRAIASDTDLGKKGRKWIIDQFPEVNRHRALAEIIGSD